MTTLALDNIVNTVLYEGYTLYPPHNSPMQNSDRSVFGRIYPKDYTASQGHGEPCLNQTECLLQTRDPAPAVEATVRFLHPMWRETGYITDREEMVFQAVPELSANGAMHRAWPEASEREVSVSLSLSAGNGNGGPRHMESPFSFHASSVLELLPDDIAIQHSQETVDGVLEILATPLAHDLYKITARISNLTPVSHPQCISRNALMMRTFASTHAILHARGGAFVSMLDIPRALEPFASQCRNIGTWPVLVGDESQGERDTLLSSPIILFDYPKLGPENGSSPRGPWESKRSSVQAALIRAMCVNA